MSQVFVSWLWLMRRAKWGLLAMVVGIMLFELIQPVAIRSFGDLSQLEKIMTFVPKSFFALMNVTPDFLIAVGLPGYLSLGFTHPVYHLLAAAMVIWFAARSLAGEMERGSLQMAASRPLSRAQIYLARVLGLLTVVLAISVLGPVGMIVGLLAARPDGTIVYQHFVAQGIAAGLLAASIGGVALLLSARADRMGQAVGWAIGALVLSYVVDYFANLWSALGPLDPFSIFNYYDPASALALGIVPLRSVIVLLTVAVTGAVAGLIVFRQRDFPA